MNRLVEILKKPTTWAVIIFVVIYTWGALRDAEAVEVDAVVGLGFGSTHESTAIVEEAAVQFDEKWTVGVMHIGNEPRLEDTYGVFAVRRVWWRKGKEVEPWLDFGVAYFEHAPEALVNAELTYQLAAGVRWRDVLDLAWVHYSTAGRADPNKGLDFVVLRAVLSVK